MNDINNNLNKVERIRNWGMNHPVISLVIIFFICIVPFLTVTNLSLSIFNLKQDKEFRKISGNANSITPKQISNAMSRLSPSQRNNFGEQYKGIKVDWNLYFFDIRDLNNGMALIVFTQWGLDFPNIKCELKLLDYPELKIMKENTIINVKGTINSIDHSFISLNDVVLAYNVK